MADGAFETFEFVLDVNPAFFPDFLVAFGTGHSDVFTGQLEGCFVVVEPADLPVLRSVAPGTIRNAVHFKLLMVVVFMAGETLVR